MLVLYVYCHPLHDSFHAAIRKEALAGLKKDFRLAVILRDIQGLSYEEIASVLEISVGTVKSRIARGREMLRLSIKQQGRASFLTGCHED